MAISDTTANTMSDWFTKSLAGASSTSATPATATSSTAQTPATSNVWGSAAQASPTSTATQSGTSTSPVDVSQWYTDITGRKADAQGMSYWNNRLASGENTDSVYKDFITAAQNNNDYNPGSYPNQLNLDSLQTRNVTPQQTVAGQIQGLLDTNSNYIQSARDRAQRAANARGLSNSSIAASAGEDSAYQAALPIATSDATAYRDADSYNAALYNQGLMYNTDALNTAQQQRNQLNADKAAQQATLGSQMSIAELQAATSKYQADKNEATSKYNTDAATKQQADQNKNTLVNNIIQTPDLSPDRKAELLKQLGESGLASAIYVANDIASDLQGSGGWSSVLAPAVNQMNGG